MKINNLEKFRAVVASGKTAFGMVITMFDPSMTEMAADSGMDFVWIDMEHSPMTITDVHGARAAASTFLTKRSTYMPSMPLLPKRAPAVSWTS